MSARLYDDERITVFGLFAEAYTGLVGRFTGQLSEHGLALIEFEVLVRLARSPDQRLRMTELSGQVALTTSGITRVVDRLERDTLVRRQACPSDRRGAWAVLTEAGLTRLTAALPGHLALLEQHFIGRFAPSELELVEARLRGIRDDVHPAAAPSPPETHPASAPAPPFAPAPPSATEPRPAATGKTSGRSGPSSNTVTDLPDESVIARG